MKKIELLLTEEDALPFWNINGIEVSITNYENFTTTDKQFLEDLVSWIKGIDPYNTKKEADQA